MSILAGRVLPIFVALTWLFWPVGFAASGEPWVRIEEDWSLIVDQPDQDTNSPQLSIYLTPDPENVDCYFQLQLNHAAEAGFSGGGFRVSAVHETLPVDEARSDTRAILNNDQDEITWTSVMALANNNAYFAIKNGRSDTWGQFGGPEYLVHMPGDGLESLENYSPYQSIADVDVGFGKNRVKSLTLKRVRVYFASGTSRTIETNLDAL